MPLPKPRPKRHVARRSPTLGRKIRRARAKAGLTQLALAHKIGCRGHNAGATICRIESGQQRPRIDTLARISKALKTPLAELL